MGAILFALFAITEIVLTVLTCTKFCEKKIWYKNRLIFSAAEFVLLIAVVLFQNHKWRFTGCIVIIAVRLAISGIVFLVRRNKAEGNKSKIGRIIGALMSIILIGSSLIPAFVFAGYGGFETTGEYGVKSAKAILTDNSRLEKNEDDGSNREVPIHFYYPDGNAENCPFVLFAHGSFGYYQSNDSLYKELASNGYVVASIDHPYYAFFTEDTDGKIITVDTKFMADVMDESNDKVSDPVNVTEHFKEWFGVRAADENFVLDSIKSAKSENVLNDSWYTDDGDKILDVLGMTDMGKIGLTGHSIGGATAVKLGRERDDITAVIDIDGTMASERDVADGKYVYNDTPYPIPVLALDNEEHGGYYVNSPEPDMDYINKHVMDNAVDGREMSFEGTAHMDFTDLPLLSPVLAKMLGKGTVDPTEFIPQLNAIVLNYFNYYLKGEGELTVDKWNASGKQD